jgi:dienelactone hydrolase
MKQIPVLFALMIYGMAVVAGPAQETQQVASGEETVENQVVTREISYSAGGQNLIGYLAYDPAADGPRPGILVVHEWLGLNEYAKKRAEDLAREGYVAFALDMYGDGIVVDPSEARTYSQSVGSDFPLIRQRFDAALAVLKDQDGVDPDRIAAIGYCFGGGIVLNMARMGTDIAGVVSFHGSINTGLNAGPGDVSTKILAIQGDGDPVAPEARREAFRQEMAAAGADYELIVYENVAAHNFTNPDGSTYFPEEAERAWQTMLEFFNQVF